MRSSELSELQSELAELQQTCSDLDELFNAAEKEKSVRFWSFNVFSLSC